jgi:hypothetical protein
MVFWQCHLSKAQMVDTLPFACYTNGENRSTMPTPGKLVEAMAQALGLSAATVAQYDRVLAENGLRSKGGRGLSAARVTATDAVNLLIAIMGSPISGGAIKDAARTCKLYAALPNLEDAAKRETFKSYGLNRLAGLPAKHNLRTALVALIEGAINGELMIWSAPDDAMSGADKSLDDLLRVRLDGPSPWAQIIAHVPPHRGIDPKSWGRLVYTRIPENRKDLRQSREVTFRTIRMLAGNLQEVEHM